MAAVPLDNSIFNWHGNLRGPENSVFKGGVFHVSITFPPNYPVSPPTITLFSDVPHPNVFGRSLCLDMLVKKNSKDAQLHEGWTSAYSVEGILVQLQSFLFDVHQNAEFSVDNKGNRIIDAKFKKAVDDANAFKCSECNHRGPIEPYPKFHDKDTEPEEYVVVREPKKLLEDEMMCFHSRTRLAE